MKYFNDILEDTTLVWVVFREEDNKQAFLNYLGSFSSANRYQNVIVAISKYPLFKKANQYNLEDGYNYLYANGLPAQLVEDYIKLMGDIV